MLVSRLHDDGGPVYKVEGAVFYTLRRMIVWELTIGVYRGSLLDRWLGARAR